MKLTQNHIEELYKFTCKHYVEYYDVQTELVDHLANDIEEISLENPNLSFEQARDNSFKKFGIFGFLNVVQAKEVQMTKKYLKIILKFVKEWFKTPKILLTLTLLFGFYIVQKLPFAYLLYSSIIFLVLVSQIIVITLNSIRIKKKFKVTGEKWMFEKIISVSGLGTVSVFLFYFFDFPFSSSKDFLMMGDFRRFLSAFLITLLLLLGYVTIFVIPKKATKLLQETYKEYKML